MPAASAAGIGVAPRPQKLAFAAVSGAAHFGRPKDGMTPWGVDTCPLSGEVQSQTGHRAAFSNWKSFGDGTLRTEIEHGAGRFEVLQSTE